MKRLLTLLTILSILSFPHSAFAATITTYSGTPANSTRLGDTTSNWYVAQQFTATASGTVDSLKIYERSETGTPTDGIIVEIWSDDGSDQPNALIGSATETIVAGSIVNGNNSWDVTEFTTVTFSSPASVTNGTKYHVVMRRSGSADSSNYRNMWRTATSGEGGSDTYAGGTALFANTTPTWTTLTGADFATEITITEAGGGATPQSIIWFD